MSWLLPTNTFYYSALLIRVALEVFCELFILKHCYLYLIMDWSIYESIEQFFILLQLNNTGVIYRLDFYFLVSLSLSSGTHELFNIFPFILGFPYIAFYDLYAGWVNPPPNLPDLNFFGMKFV